MWKTFRQLNKEPQRLYEKSRQHTKRFYSTNEWRGENGLRAETLKANPMCSVCKYALATEVDHIVPIAVAPERARDKTNLQSICDRCHSRKTANEMHERGEL